MQKIGGILMLGKCANPDCVASFRKLGEGKLFAFETLTIANSIDSNSIRTMNRNPVFFWLCEGCSLIFTLQLDSSGELTMQSSPNGTRVTIFDTCPLDHNR
jgi:hypothetical protein